MHPVRGRDRFLLISSKMMWCSSLFSSFSSSCSSRASRAFESLMSFEGSCRASLSKRKLTCCRLKGIPTWSTGNTKSSHDMCLGSSNMSSSLPEAGISTLYEKPALSYWPSSICSGSSICSPPATDGCCDLWLLIDLSLLTKGNREATHYSWRFLFFVN